MPGVTRKCIEDLELRSRPSEKFLICSQGRELLRRMYGLLCCTVAMMGSKQRDGEETGSDGDLVLESNAESEMDGE